MIRQPVIIWQFVGFTDTALQRLRAALLMADADW
jgi:hypothetical protein